MTHTIELKQQTLQLITPLTLKLEQILQEKNIIEEKQREVTVLLKSIITSIIAQEGIDNLSIYDIKLEADKIILTEQLATQDLDNDSNIE